MATIEQRVKALELSTVPDEKINFIICFPEPDGKDRRFRLVAGGLKKIEDDCRESAVEKISD